MPQTRAQIRAQEDANEDANRRCIPEDQGQDSPTRKRQRRTTHPTPSEEIQGEDPIGFWAREGVWPRELFKVDMYQHALARRRSPGRQRSSSATSTTPSEAKSAQYRDPRFAELLETKGVFMYEHDQGITAESETSLMALLTSEQTIPTESLFRDDLFNETCRNVAKRNEARVVRDISPLIVPPAEVLAIYGSAGLERSGESPGAPPEERKGTCSTWSQDHQKIPSLSWPPLKRPPLKPSDHFGAVLIMTKHFIPEDRWSYRYDIAPFMTYEMRYWVK